MLKNFLIYIYKYFHNNNLLLKNILKFLQREFLGKVSKTVENEKEDVKIEEFKNTFLFTN